MSNHPRKGSPRPLPSPSAARRGPRPIVVIVGGVVVLAALIAVIAALTASNDSPDTTGVEQTRPVAVSGTALAKYAGDPDPAKGVAAPTLTGATFDGSPLVIAAGGKPTVVAFVAHWCPHCRNEVPVITKWLAGGKQPAGSAFLAVATATSASQPNYPPSQWLAGENWTVPTLADDAASSAANAFGVTAFPFFVALDRDGKVAARTSGELTTDALLALFRAAGA